MRKIRIGGYHCIVEVKGPRIWLDEIYNIDGVVNVDSMLKIQFKDSCYFIGYASDDSIVRREVYKYEL